MSVRLKLPIVVDASLLRFAIEASVKANTDLRIETFYQIKDGSTVIECDEHAEVMQYVNAKTQPTPTDEGTK